MGQPSGSPGGDDTVLVYLFSLQGGELYSFGNNFAGPQDLFESWSMVGPVVKSRLSQSWISGNFIVIDRKSVV